MRVAIISDKLGTKGNEASTLIADEALKRKYKVVVISPDSFSLSNNGLFAAGYQYPDEKKNLRLNLAKDFDVIHFRPNPPVDMNYLTMLYQLETIKDKVLIANCPVSIINFPEKILPLKFAEFMAPTIITKQANEVKDFLSVHKEIIVKPIYDFGGNGVHKISKSNSKDIDTIIAKAECPVIAQKYIPKVTEGDKRIILIDGKVVGAFLRVPKKGTYLANTVHGSSVRATKLTAKEEKLCKILRPFLLQNDILTCGLDIIGGFLTEINITSVGGFQHIYNLYGTKPEEKLWNAIDAKLNKRAVRKSR